MNCKRDILAVKTVWHNPQQRAWLKVFLYDDSTFNILGVQCFGQCGARTWAEESSVLPDLLEGKLKKIRNGPACALTDSAEQVFADLPNIKDPVCPDPIEYKLYPG